MVKSRLLFLSLLLVLGVSSKAAAIDDKTVEAIDAGIDYLLPATTALVEELESQSKGGSLAPSQESPLGPLAMQVYALVVAGVGVDHPTIRRSFDLLSRMSLTHTYTVALYVFALDAAISQVEEDLLMLASPKVQARFRDDPSIGKEYRPRLQAAIESFLRSQNQLGVWRYAPGAQDFDNSNVQFAVLAVGVGPKRSITVDSSVWIKIMDHFVKGQQKEGPETTNRIKLKSPEERGKKRDEVRIVSKEGDEKAKRKPASKKAGKKDEGKTVVPVPQTPKEDPEIGTESFQVFERGWDYENKGGATWNMTCAGLSSLLLARDNLRGKLTPEAKTALDRAIWDGYGWVMGHWGFEGNYYGMYSLEKVGDLGEVEKFASHDWYAEMEGYLLKTQKGDGSWAANPGGHARTDAMATGYALLILKRATSLISMNRKSLIRISGKRTSDEEETDRSWVYVPDLDTTIHYPSLMQAIRLRPSAKLIKFLRNIIDNYDVMYKGELVPELTITRDAITNKTAKGVVEDYLVDITGFKYDDPNKYESWYKRWMRVLAMGQSQKPDYRDRLLGYYKATTKSVPLKKTIMWALYQCKVKEAIPLLLDDLGNPDAYIRLEAYKTFKDFFIERPPPFDPNASDSARAAQVEAIRAWYGKQTL